MKVFFHIKGNINGSNSEEEISLIVLHLLHQLFIPLDKPENQLKGKHSSPSKVCLGILSLKT
jgi:hypothetical protein